MMVSQIDQSLSIPIKAIFQTLIFIPYDELTNDIEEFVNGISSVKFGLRYSPAKGPILLQYAKECSGRKLF
jgi:hypothetical protein